MAKIEWFYVDGEDRRGPFFFEEIRHAFQAGELTLDSKLWREGMDAPQPIGQLPEMAQILRPEPPPPEYPNRVLKPGPWSRFLARSIDLALWYLPFHYLPWPWLTEDRLMLLWRQSPLIFIGLALVQVSVTLLGQMLIDALVMAAVGTTPGKALLRLTIRRPDGGRIGLPGLLSRAIRLWVYGLGGGFLPLTIWRLWRSYTQTADGFRAPWDEPQQLVIAQRPVKGWRWAAAITLLLVALLAGADFRQGVKWENGETQRSVWVPAGWTLKFDPPRGVSLFQAPEDPAVKPVAQVMIRLHTGVPPDIDLNSYGGLVQQNSTVGTLKLRDLQRDPAGGEFLLLSYDHTISGNSYEIDIRLWRKKNGFWTIMAMKPVLTPQANREADTLAHALFWTLPID